MNKLMNNVKQDYRVRKVPFVKEVIVKKEEETSEEETLTIENDTNKEETIENDTSKKEFSTEENSEEESSNKKTSEEESSKEETKLILEKPKKERKKKGKNGLWVTKLVANEEEKNKILAGLFLVRTYPIKDKKERIGNVTNYKCIQPDCEYQFRIKKIVSLRYSYTKFHNHKYSLNALNFSLIKKIVKENLTQVASEIFKQLLEKAKLEKEDVDPEEKKKIIKQINNYKIFVLSEENKRKKEEADPKLFKSKIKKTKKLPKSDEKNSKRKKNENHNKSDSEYCFSDSEIF